MKKIAISAALALALSAGSALAADLPSIKGQPIPLPPPPLWTGFYAGLNAGGTFGGGSSINVLSFPVFAIPSTINVFPTPASLSAALASSGTLPSGSSGGFIGGGQIGFNWQFYSNFVAGIEADIQGVASSHGTSTQANIVNANLPNILTGGFFPNNFVGATIAGSKTLDYLGTVRGRLGYLVTPTLLVYGTGGLAYGGVSSSTSIFGANIGLNLGLCCGNPPFFSNGSFSDTRVGWTAGGGLEWMFWPNWSAKVEYLYYDLGSVNYSAGVATPISTVGVAGFPVGSIIYALASQSSTRFDGHIVRAGVNYHFNRGAAPVMAKY